MCLRVARSYFFLVETFAVSAVNRRTATNVTLTERHNPRCGSKIQSFVAFRREVAIEKRSPFSENAGAQIPRACILRVARRVEVIQTRVCMEAVPLDEICVVTGAACIHRRHRISRLEHILTLIIQERESRVNGGNLYWRWASGSADGHAAHHKNHQEKKTGEVNQWFRLEVFCNALHRVEFPHLATWPSWKRLPHSIGSPS